MISGNLKNVFYLKKIRKALGSKSDVKSEFSGKAGLIIDADNLDEKWKLTDFYELVQLKKENFYIVICGSRQNLPEDIEAAVLDSKEISLRGEFRSEEIRSFTEEDFDFILCYFSKNSVASALLSALTKARIRIGNSPDEYGIYDVEIDAREVEVFQQEALKYLKILKKNN
ncbi:DUF6913 domain-containing protein [Gramella sp. KN1008]|uniref:DUF6913 domain-containing protein n=1 Tax=Gramella sp. KN1008 TaxID=2529298 RepID=UPI00103AEBF1|nr:hypothetical protein [Gramella sp. KN1008]TBW26751.1 hypothetical protein EZJ28_12970 [Gramella sp. KN1008]